MAQTKGRIDSLRLFDQFCCVRVLGTEDGDATFLLLWSYWAQEDNARNRLLHGQFLSLARDALADNRVVTFNHDDGSALVESLIVE